MAGYHIYYNGNATLVSDISRNIDGEVGMHKAKENSDSKAVSAIYYEMQSKKQATNGIQSVQLGKKVGDSPNHF